MAEVISKTRSFAPILSPALSAINTILTSHPRRSGYYLVRLVSLDVPPAEAWAEATLGAVFEAMDDHPWPPAEMRPADLLWSDNETTAESARAESIDALVGGSDVGHALDTIPGTLARDLWERFEQLFGPERRYYRGLGLGDRRYVFQDGVAVVDSQRAGIVCVVEDD